MDARARSIDHAASGYLRHRFMRAFGASWNVLVMAGMVTLIVMGTLASAPSVEGGLAMAAFAAPFAFAILILVFLVPIVLGVAISSAVADSFHRRLVALAGLLVAGFIVVFAPLGMLGAAGELFGFIPDDDPSDNLAPWQTGVMAAMLALTMLVALEAAGWAWWQLTTGKDGFMAARGWRPPIWRLLSTYRRHLGLPAFLANFGRGRVGLSVLYFFVAVMNAGLVVALVLPLLVFAEANDGNERMSLYLTATALGGLLLLNLFGAGRFIDAIADKRATQLYQNVREWDARPPVVFLRAFEQDDAKLAAVSFDPFVKLAAGVGTAKTMDEILLENASPYGPVIAIGDPRDPTPPLGAARIFVPGEDNNWQAVVSSLVSAAKCVVMCPTTSAGVRWELELLARSNATGKTIFLANPEIAEAETEPLFATLFLDGGRFPEIKRGQTPIAAFQDPVDGWRVLTAKRRSQQSYAIALNIALQALFGRNGVPLAKPPKKQKRARSSA